MVYHIQRSATPDAVVFLLSGDMDSGHVTRLKEFLASEAVDRVTLDLSDITLVERDAVAFLAGAEASGVRLVNCPEYVRRWITATRESQPESEQASGEQAPRS